MLKYETLLGSIRSPRSMMQSRSSDSASHHISVEGEVDTYDVEKRLLIPKDSCRRAWRMRYLPQIATRDPAGLFQCASSLISSSDSFVSWYTPSDCSSYTFVARTLAIGSKSMVNVRRIRWKTRKCEVIPHGDRVDTDVHHDHEKHPEPV